MKKIILLVTTLVTILLTTSSFADNIHCPRTIKCTGNTMGTCTLSDGSEYWSAHSALNLEAGVYNFHVAIAQHPTGNESICTYVNNNPMVVVYVLSKIALEANAVPGTDWIPARHKTYSCVQSIRNPLTCPYKQRL